MNDVSRDIEAIYIQGHLIPQSPVDLREQQRVRVHVEPLDMDAPRGDIDTTGMTLHDALVATGLLGCVRGLPEDLSTNAMHMEGFGEHQDGPR